MEENNLLLIPPGHIDLSSASSGMSDKELAFRLLELEVKCVELGMGVDFVANSYQNYLNLILPVTKPNSEQVEK